MRKIKMFFMTLAVFLLIGFAADVYAEDITGASVSGISATYPYTGEAITPVPTVKLSGQTLVKDTDYSVTYENNINLTTDTSKAVVTITGKGDYEGTIVKNFNIKEAIYSLNGNLQASSFPTALNNGTYKLLQDVTMTANRLVLGTFASDVTLDLNGHTLSFPGNASYSVIHLGRTSGQSLNIIGPGTIKDNNNVAVSVIGVVGSKYNISVGEGVKLIGTTGILIGKDATNNKISFTGEIESSSYSIYSNGKIANPDSNNTFTINGKAVAADGPAIYAAGYAKWNVNANLTGDSAIEIRSGEMNITGGTYTGTSSNYTVVPNSDGTTTTGAGIAVVQHTTKNPIDVNVTGGAFKACVPVNEANPQSNSASDLAKIDISVTEGTFTTTCTKTVDSSDFTKFVSGGTYNVAPEAKYIKDSYAAYKLGSNYVIDRDNSNLSAPSEVYIEAGKELKNAFTASPLDYVTTSVSENGIVSVEGTTIKGLTPGTVTLTVKLNKVGGEITKTINVIVYKINDPVVVSETEEVDEDQVKDDNKAVIKSELSNVIKEVLADKEVVGVDDELKDKIVESVMNGDPIDTEIVFTAINENDATSDIAKIDKLLNDDSSYAGLFDITIKVLSGGEELGNISELSKSLKLTFDIPTNLPKVKAGYERVFTVFRVHNGVATALKTTDNGDGTVSANSNKYSVYALTYQDVKEGQLDDVPKTGDILVHIILATVLMGTVVTVSRKSIV